MGQGEQVGFRHKKTCLELDLLPFLTMNVRGERTILCTPEVPKNYLISPNMIARFTLKLINNQWSLL